MEDLSHSEEIDRFLKGQMGEFELSLFQHKLSQDDDLQYEVEIRKKTHEYIELQRIENLRDYIQKNTPKRVQFSFWQEVLLYSSVACILFFAVTFAYLKIYFPDNNKHFAIHKNKKELPPNPVESLHYEPPVISQPHQGTNTDNLISSDSKTKGFITTEDAETVPMEYNLSESGSESAPMAEDQYDVKTDLIMLDTMYSATVVAMAPAQESVNMDDVDSRLKTPTPATRRSESEKKSKSTPTEGNNYTKLLKDSAKIVRVGSMSLKTEFWNSPINYRGYKYYSQRLQLFGLRNYSQIKFKVYNDELYMIYEGQVFHLVQEDRFNGYWPESDKNLLKILR